VIPNLVFMMQHPTRPAEPEQALESVTRAGATS
jgi:hypothetical protein